jgi:hypothetical protein
MSVERVAQLEAWVGKMDVSEEQRTLAFEYLAGVREVVAADGATPHTRHAVSMAAMLLGLWSRPVGLRKDDIEAMFATHKQESHYVPGAGPGANVVVELARALGLPAAAISVIVALSQSGLLSALARMLAGGN